MSPAEALATCAAPNECHPWLEPHRGFLLSWLEEDPVERPAVIIPMFSAFSASATYAPYRPVVVTRRRAMAPCPYVGEPVAYMWWVGTTDEHGVGDRQIAGEAWREPISWDARWRGPFSNIGLQS